MDFSHIKVRSMSSSHIDNFVVGVLLWTYQVDLGQYLKNLTLPKGIIDITLLGDCFSL